MASKAGNETSGGKKAAASRKGTQERDKAASEGSGVLLIAAGILAAAYLIFSATGYLGEMLGKALFGLIGITAYALPVILIGVGVIYIRGATNPRLNGSGWYLMLSILALVTLLSTARNSFTNTMDYMAYINDALYIGQNAHLGGGFVGKGDGRNALGRGAVVDQVGDLVRNHPCLARARTGQHQAGAMDEMHGLKLGKVETSRHGVGRRRAGTEGAP